MPQQARAGAWKAVDALAGFLARSDQVLREGRLGLLCNQVSYSFTEREYLYRLLARRGVLQRCFLPEHGLFAELQDQIPLDETGLYRSQAPNTDFVSLYGSHESSLAVGPEKLRDLDALVIDVQDVGARYYTFFVTTVYLIRAFAKERPHQSVFVIDRPNPAGRQIEGTPLAAKYESFVGLRGLPHRHGLTIGELCRLIVREESLAVDLQVIPAAGPVFPIAADGLFAVLPSPNMPALTTASVYAGQCLLEGTNISEGRGTTRPFEIFGAAYIDAFALSDSGRLPGAALLRPLCFVPSFHKYAGEVCGGWQIHPEGPYHSLAHTLALMRFLGEQYPSDFRFRTGVYEYRSDRLAIEILTGDDLLIDYLQGRGRWADVQQALGQAEEDWLKRVLPHLIYEAPPQRTPAGISGALP